MSSRLLHEYSPSSQCLPTLETTLLMPQPRLTGGGGGVPWTYTSQDPQKKGQSKLEGAREHLPAENKRALRPSEWPLGLGSTLGHRWADRGARKEHLSSLPE